MERTRTTQLTNIWQSESIKPSGASVKQRQKSISIDFKRFRDVNELLPQTQTDVNFNLTVVLAFPLTTVQTENTELCIGLRLHQTDTEDLWLPFKQHQSQTTVLPPCKKKTKKKQSTKPLHCDAHRNMAKTVHKSICLRSSEQIKASDILFGMKSGVLKERVTDLRLRWAIT